MDNCTPPKFYSCPPLLGSSGIIGCPAAPHQPPSRPIQHSHTSAFPAQPPTDSLSAQPHL